MQTTGSVLGVEVVRPKEPTLHLGQLPAPPCIIVKAVHARGEVEAGEHGSMMFAALDHNSDIDCKLLQPKSDEIPPRIIVDGAQYFSHAEVLRLHKELSQQERNDPESLQELRIDAARTEIDQAAHLLSVANSAALSREHEIKRLHSKVSTLEEVSAVGGYLTFYQITTKVRAEFLPSLLR